MSEVELIVINPVEWDFKRFRCYRYLEISIDPLLQAFKLNGLLELHKIRNVDVREDPYTRIGWQRKNRPLIFIDLVDECIKVQKTALVQFDREDIEHQASFVLRLLKKFNVASFLRKRVDFLPSRVGYDALERKQYYGLIERGIMRRMEIYGLAPIANRKTSRKRVNEMKNLSALKRFQESEKTVSV